MPQDQHLVLCFDPAIAEAASLNEAIVVNQMIYWLELTNERGERTAHLRDGVYWIYNTYEDWQRQFPFWSDSTIRRAIDKLEERGVVVSTDQYNQMPTDRTKWYRVVYDVLYSLGQNDQVDLVKMTDSRDGQNDQVLPETTPENTPPETTPIIPLAPQPGDNLPPEEEEEDEYDEPVEGVFYANQQPRSKFPRRSRLSRPKKERTYHKIGERVSGRIKGSGHIEAVGRTQPRREKPNTPPLPKSTPDTNLRDELALNPDNHYHAMIMKAFPTKKHFKSEYERDEWLMTAAHLNSLEYGHQFFDLVMGWRLEGKLTQGGLSYLMQYMTAPHAGAHGIMARDNYQHWIDEGLIGPKQAQGGKSAQSKQDELIAHWTQNDAWTARQREQAAQQSDALHATQPGGAP